MDRLYSENSLIDRWPIFNEVVTTDAVTLSMDKEEEEDDNNHDDVADDDRF